MRSNTLRRTQVAVVAAAVLALGLGACSSDKGTTTSATSSTSVSTSASTSKLSPRSIDSTAGPNETIASYIKSAGISETKVKPGVDGAPKIDLPIPAGWADAGDKTPDFAAGAIIYTGPDASTASYTPNIIGIMSKLTGNVDAQKLIDLAGGEMKNLPGFSQIGKGEVGTLSGYPSYKIAGTYNLNGMTAVTAQQTVVIPGPDGTYILQFNATSNEDQATVLEAALDAIDRQTKISF